MKMEFYRYTIRKVKKKGKIDGRGWRWKFFPPRWPFQEEVGVEPSVEQKDPSEFEKELIQAANKNLNIIVQKWHEMDQKLLQNCKNAEDRYIKAKESWQKEANEHNIARQQYEKAKEQFNSYPRPKLAAEVFWLIFTIITIGEVAFNALVFNVFGQEKIHTYIMALGLMIAIPWLADFIGKNLRTEEKSKTTIILMIIAGITVIAGLIVIAIAREKFFEANKVVEALGIQWDYNNIILTFFIVNIVLFVAILVLAYEAGHKNPAQYNQLKDNYKRAKAELKKEGSEDYIAADILENAKEEFNKAHSERIHKYEKIRAEAQEEIESWIHLIQVYRTANMQARKEKKTPESFKIDPSVYVKLPDVFKNLDCYNCCYGRG